MSKNDETAPYAEQVLRARLSDDLKQALKARVRAQIAPLRSLMAVLDNAGAVEMRAPGAPVFGGAGDVPRHELSKADVQAIVATEIGEREVAIARYAELGETVGANRLRAELGVTARYRDVG